MELTDAFNNVKTTENGDLAYKSTSNKLLDILFMSEYYKNNTDKLPNIVGEPQANIFASFMRDPRLGMGCKNVGRTLLGQVNASPEEILACGRADDLWIMAQKFIHLKKKMYDFLFNECQNNNALVKKWMPRYSSKNLMVARQMAKYFGLNKQQYGHFVKVTTTESQLSEHKEEEIKFEQVPSLAAIKYAKTFDRKQHERYQKYLQDVREGKKELHVSTTTMYDIYKNRDKIDADLFISKLDATPGSWLPVIDVSGSMCDSHDSIGKALAIGYYLAITSCYLPNNFITFSERPEIVKLQEGVTFKERLKQIERSHWGMNTDLSAVMQTLRQVDGQLPEYLVILSDMEFDYGSSQNKDELMNQWKKNGITTKIVWWNFNSRNVTCPEIDIHGNIFMSGYNPMLLQYLEARFDGKMFLDKLLKVYQQKREL